MLFDFGERGAPFPSQEEIKSITQETSSVHNKTVLPLAFFSYFN